MVKLNLKQVKLRIAVCNQGGQSEKNESLMTNAVSVVLQAIGLRPESFTRFQRQFFKHI